MKHLLLNITLAVMFLQGAAQVNISVNGVTAQLREEHPRLILTAERLVELKEAYRQDQVLQRYVSDVLAKADTLLAADNGPIERIVGERDMLGVSRHAVMKIYNLAFAWRWTADRRYLEAAKTALLSVSHFTDWHPKHFLDVAEMTHAAAIGYDWLYDELRSDEKETVRNAIKEKGLDEGLKIYSKSSGFHMRVNNWNQVCNSGMVIGALAIGETEPDYLREIVGHAVNTMPKAMATFDPEGVCVEGPGYWHYAVRYCAYGFASMESALGTDFGLSEVSPGFAKTGYFPTVTTGPTGLMLSYADTKMRSVRKPLPPLMWLAGRFDNPDFSEPEHNVLQRYPAEVFHLLYYIPRSGKWNAQSGLDRYLESEVPLACMRSGHDAEALFVGVKGGTTEVSHVQLDMGNFELDALGERWLLDLGSDSYSLPGYFDFKKRRWNYYRNQTRSHNLPIFNGKEQCLKTHVHFETVALDREEPYVVLDLTDAYRDVARSVSREIKMVAGRKAVVVKDQFDLRRKAKMNWGVMTDAEIILDGSRAELRFGNKTLIATIISPAGAVFEVESAEQEPPQGRNEGINRLAINAEGVKRETVCVLFSPVWEEGEITPDMARLF